MKQYLAALSVLLFVILLTPACSDPTLVGSDLLEDDQVKLSVIDTITLNTYTERGDSSRTFSPFESNQLSTYLVGRQVDPVFGVSESILSAQVYLQNLTTTLSGRYDSLVFVLPIDSLGTYGQQPQEYGFEVRALAEELDNDEEYFSNQRFMTEDEVIGSTQEIYNPFAFQSIYNPELDSTILVRQVRIRMDDALGQELFQLDTAFYRTDSAFIEQVKGFQVRGTTDNAGMLAFNLRNSQAGLTLYYTVDDTLSRSFNFSFPTASVRTLNFSNDYSNTPVGDALMKGAQTDSLFYAQGMTGVQGVIEMPYIEDLKGTIINQAILEIPIVNDDTNVFPSAQQLILASKDLEGQLIVIDDVLLAGTNLTTLFGGNIVAGVGDEPDFYQMNITTHLQDMIAGREENRLIVSVFPKQQRASRVILGGTDHAFSPRLKVTLTQL